VTYGAPEPKKYLSREVMTYQSNKVGQMSIASIYEIDLAISLSFLSDSTIKPVDEPLWTELIQCIENAGDEAGRILIHTFRYTYLSFL